MQVSLSGDAEGRLHLRGDDDGVLGRTRASHHGGGNGLTERVDALGGTLHGGPDGPGRRRVRAVVPRGTAS